MQNPPKSQFVVRARVLQHSRSRSTGHTKCNCALRAQTNTIMLFQETKSFPHVGKILLLTLFRSIASLSSTFLIIASQMCFLGKALGSKTQSSSHFVRKASSGQFFTVCRLLNDLQCWCLICYSSGVRIFR